MSKVFDESTQTRANSSQAAVGAQLSVLWRKKFTILLVAILAVAAAVAIDYQRTPQYQSQATLLILDQGAAGAGGSSAGGSSAVAPGVLATDVQLIEGASIKALVAKDLGRPAPPVTVTLIPSTQLATITVTSSNPQFSAKAANAYANAYIKNSQAGFVNSQATAEKAIQDQITALTNQITALQGQANNTKDPTTFNSLQSQIQGKYAQQSALGTQLSALQLATSQSSAGARLITPAKPATSPSSPQKARDAGIAFGVGLLVAIAFVLIRDYLDDRIQTKADLDELSEGIPALGLIPVISDWKDRKAPLLVASARPKSPPAEAYRGLRTSIQFTGLDQPINTLQVTSAAAADGKTTTAANLAVTMAQAGQEVVLIGCDLRRPRIQEFFDLSNDVGFTSVLVGDATLEDALISVPNVDRLTLLPSGPIPPNPSELLGSPRASEVFSVLGKEADLVIIDSPPVLPVTDAAVLAGKVDAVLLVVSAGGTTKREIARSIEALGRVDAAIVGTVLNKAPESDSYAYYRYGYGYGYGSRSKSDRATTNGARTGGQDFSVRPVSAPIRSARPEGSSLGAEGNGSGDPVMPETKASEN